MSLSLYLSHCIRVRALFLSSFPFYDSYLFLAYIFIFTLRVRYLSLSTVSAFYYTVFTQLFRKYLYLRITKTLPQ
jgi:hypothetical protein